MTSTMKVFVAVLAACALIGALTADERNWFFFTTGAVIVAAVSAAVFALLQRLGRRSREPAPH